ncbi:enoyl-CoA hydratase/isomerase family protein [Pseudoroseomonas ludipueritiae]|uniref:enoyl-CoA hydratase/isomerase family protein n=1 Tax=Pseudoroseomonas ludipueritiae TaxID=198093 RepID=UPI003461B927
MLGRRHGRVLEGRDQYRDHTDLQGHPAPPRNIGRKATTELILTGRRFDAAEALRLGLVNRVVPPLACSMPRCPSRRIWLPSRP